MTIDQKEAQRYDRPTGRSKVFERSRKQLHACLNEKGVILQQQRGYTKKRSSRVPTNNGIALTKQRDITNPGWQDKPKGLLQVLCERGLIRSDELDKYTVDGRKDAITGKADFHFSLRHILGKKATRSNSVSDAQVPCQACWKVSSTTGGLMQRLITDVFH